MQCSDLLLYCVAPYNLFVSLSAGVCVSTLPHVYQLLVSRAFSVCVVCSCLNQAALGCMGSSALHRCSTIRPAVLPVLHAWTCCLCGWVLPAWMWGQCLRRPHRCQFWLPSVCIPSAGHCQAPHRRRCCLAIWVPVCVHVMICPVFDLCTWCLCNVCSDVSCMRSATSMFGLLVCQGSVLLSEVPRDGF